MVHEEQDSMTNNGKTHSYPGKRRGPKGKWGKIDPIKVAALAGKLGATTAELAAALDVTSVAINEWQKKHPELALTLKNEKAKADAAVVKSLYQRAKGYSHNAVKIVVVDGKVKKVPYVEHYPPDTTACIYWLKNRDPQNWRDRSEHTISNADGSNISTTVIAPTVVFVQPKKEDLTEVIDVKEVTNGDGGQ